MASAISLLQFEEAVHNLSRKAVLDEKTFDTIFQVEGVPLWWFYNRFITKNMIPFLPSFAECYKALDTGISSRNINSVFSAKMLWLSEEIKQKKTAKKYFETEKFPEPILFLTYTNHLTAKGIYRLESILQRLQEKNIVPLPLLSSPFTERPHRFNSGLYIYHFIDDKLIKEAKTKARELYHLWKKKGRKALKEAGLWPQLEAHVSFLFSEEFLYLTFLYYSTFKKAIKETKTPLICITANIGLMEKCAIVAGENLNVPVLHLQHGFDTDFRKTETAQFRYLHYAVFGEEDKKLLIETGVDGNKIYPTGGTFFDDLERYLCKTTEKIMVKKVLLLSQPWVKDKMWSSVQRDAFLADLEKICTKLDAELSIKLHPRDDSAFYEQFSKGKKVRIVKDNLYEEIHEADLIVSVISTTISESVALNKPVLVLDLYNDAAEKAYVQRGVVLYARSEREAMEKLTAFLTYFCGPDFAAQREKYVRDYLFSLDGKATPRVVEVMERLIKNKNI